MNSPKPTWVFSSRSECTDERKAELWRDSNYTFPLLILKVPNCASFFVVFILAKKPVGWMFTPDPSDALPTFTPGNWNRKTGIVTSRSAVVSLIRVCLTGESAVSTASRLLLKPSSAYLRLGRLAKIFDPHLLSLRGWTTPSLSQEYSDRRELSLSRFAYYLRKPYCPKGACCKSVGEW